MNATVDQCDAEHYLFEGPDRFTCSADAIFTLFEELMLSVKPSKQEIYEALKFLAARCQMTRVAFEIEDLGPEEVL